MNRQRLRLRIGGDIQEGLTIVHLRLASGTGQHNGTNRKGYIVWTAYNLTDSTQLKLKYYNSKIKDDRLKPAPVLASDPNPTNSRTQVDFSVKF